MKKILIVLLVLFVLFDIGLAVVFFNPKLRTSKLLDLLPKNCKVVDSKYCKSAAIVGNEKLNETVAALFSLPKGSKVYAPVSGQLSFQLTADGEKLPYHILKGADGTNYILVFEPESVPQAKQVKVGETIGVATGKKYASMKNFTLAVSTIKDQRFNKERFDALFR